MSESNKEKGYKELKRPGSCSKACEQKQVGPTQWFCDIDRYSKEIPRNTQRKRQLGGFFFFSILFTCSF